MRPESLCKIVAVISILALVISAVAIFESLKKDNDSTQCEYTLFFGMGAGVTDAEKEKLKAVAIDITVNEGSGYTCYWAEGGYRADDGTVVKGQQTLVFVLANTNIDFVKSLVKDIKSEFGLDTVMVETTKKTVEFF